jgi:hypothetical protein
MNNFRDFGIKPVLNAFTGEKIKIDRIINTEITVLQYKVEESKKKPGTQFLTLQIQVADGSNRVIFTGSTILIGMIQKVPDDKFPFKTTIIRESEHLEFT